jgi:hypothetical protein
VPKLSVNKVTRLGFEWPKYAVIEELCIVEDGRVDLSKTLENLRSRRTYYRNRLVQAFNFKMQTGADYSDFTDRYDDDARADRELAQAISYLEEMVKTVGE